MFSSSLVNTASKWIKFYFIIPEINQNGQTEIKQCSCKLRKRDQQQSDTMKAKKQLMSLIFILFTNSIE